jgi:hypothetical protein
MGSAFSILRFIRAGPWSFHDTECAIDHARSKAGGKKYGSINLTVWELSFQANDARTFFMDMISGLNSAGFFELLRGRC